MTPSERVILCEGYHDRAFWTGWLKAMGCVDPGGFDPNTYRRLAVQDPFGTRVADGHYAFTGPNGHFLRVVPCHGDRSLVRAKAEDRLKGRGTRSLDWLALNVDSDVIAGTISQSGWSPQDILHMVQPFDPGASRMGDQIHIDSGITRIGLIRWETSDPPGMLGVPDQQCLERLCCAAITDAYPGRDRAVADWLASRPVHPPDSPKSHSWSYMAGWAADHGCDDFLRSLWDDRLIAAQLERRLRASGAGAVVEAIVA